ncbi:MAG: RIP metalloprotease RseP [Kiritimatiellae bacterium]|nr:RIP metalloprotease RseP [Kiritimatiellia bacterium]
MEVLISVLAWIGVAILFSLAVFIHEFGHFLAAKKLGFKVEAFSIGFGPAIVKKVIDGVEYRIGTIPFGGYVSLPQLDPSGMEKIQGKHDGTDGKKEPQPEPEESLPDVSPWRRIVVSFAGPFGNVVLAVGLAFLIFAVPGLKTGVIGTRLGYVGEDGNSWKAGLRPGDLVVAVNGKKVETWTDFQTECLLAGGEENVALSVLREEKALEIPVTLSTNNELKLSMLDDVLPEMACAVQTVRPDSPAAAAGFEAGDLLLAVDGVQVRGTSQFQKKMAEAADRTVKVTVERGKRRLDLTVAPKFDAELNRPVIGVQLTDVIDSVKPWMMYKDPWSQLKWDAGSVVRVLKGLIRPKSKGERAAIAQNIGGPVSILSGLYRTVRGSVWDAFGFLRMICINLAILNLLPIPVLDGGHILFALYELITRRKPNPRVIAILVNTCAVLLLGLMALLVYRDIARQVKVNRAEHAMVEEQGD